MDPLSGLAPDRSGFNVLPALATEEREGPLSSGPGLQDEEVVTVLARNPDIARWAGESEIEVQGTVPDTADDRAIHEGVCVPRHDTRTQHGEPESASGLSADRKDRRIRWDQVDRVDQDATGRRWRQVKPGVRGLLERGEAPVGPDVRGRFRGIVGSVDERSVG